MVKALISVVISTKNEAQNLPRLLKSLTKERIRGLEIIVVDNFSQDKTKRIALEFGSKFYEYGNERSTQRNFGAQKASADYLLFLDADMEIPVQVLRECLRLTKKQPVAAIIPETNSGKTWFGKIKQLEKEIYLNEVLVEAPRLFNKKIFLRNGGYNPELIAGEDWDLNNRILKSGKILRIETPLIHHENSFIKEIKHKIYYAKLINKYQQLHPEYFNKQSGKNRLEIFWKKRSILLNHLTVAIGLIVVKCVEYCIYQIVRITNYSAVYLNG